MRPSRRLCLLAAGLVVAGALFLLAPVKHDRGKTRVRRKLPEVVELAATEAENNTRYDVPPGVEPYPWHYFEMSKGRKMVIEPGAEETRRGPRRGPELDELSAVFNISLAELQQRTGNMNYSSADTLGGRYRLLPGAAVQYELYFGSRGDSRSGFHTVRVTRPLQPLRVEYYGLGGHELVNVLLPYYSRLETLRQFVGRFAALVEAGEEAVLTVIRYTDGFPSMDAEQQRRDAEGAAEVVRQANSRLAACGAAPRVRLIERTGTFSRGLALMEGARAWDGDEDVILFLCDVDMVFGSEFLQRCRANTAPARQAYFPIVFSTYNPAIVYSVQNKPVVPILTSYEQGTVIKQEMGAWTTFGFGMSCQYRSDFQRLSGQFLNITGWGLEDVKLYQRFQKSDVEIVRMTDPDLVHIYHKKECNKREVGKRFNSCLRSKAVKESSQLGWGLWVYKNVGDTADVENFLLQYYSNG
ncbi:Chondroitin sulfate N-acetylgalactosaminyltransferase 1 [Amphibalanus amphitrite]|uniref:Hexosyltransferase n=1 Tax=Amphibalanus amphitrite TaxID=1232801 RepID=A0A6A4WBB5_AMPAM|nr:Chondroitin sulfate N-acetylgalactosaminyltransferase 1 [Amphibalanus amphitrite]